METRNSTAQHSAAQRSTAQHSAAQRSTAQRSLAQRNAAQHNAAQQVYVPAEPVMTAVYVQNHTCHQSHLSGLQSNHGYKSTLRQRHYFISKS